MKKYFCAIAVLMLASSVQAEEYYRSIDSGGKVHYGDKPLSDAADINKLKTSAEPESNEILPFETLRAKEKFPVTLYVAEGCGDGCEMARAYLEKRGIPFTEKMLTTADEVSAFKKASGVDQVPTMNIGKNWLIGFLESQWGKELDTAGYPKTASYGYRPSKKAVTK